LPQSLGIAPRCSTRLASCSKELEGEEHKGGGFHEAKVVATEVRLVGELGLHGLDVLDELVLCPLLGITLELIDLNITNKEITKL
jgi:hypothetical protein